MTNIVMINVFFHIAWGAMCTSAFIFASMLAVLWAQPPCAGGRVLDRSGERTDQRAALLPDHCGAGCFAGHHFDGLHLMAQRSFQDFQMIQARVRFKPAAYPAISAWGTAIAFSQFSPGRGVRPAGAGAERTILGLCSKTVFARN
jgi:hypothetical protein